MILENIYVPERYHCGVRRRAYKILEGNDILKLPVLDCWKTLNHTRDGLPNYGTHFFVSDNKRHQNPYPRV